MKSFIYLFICIFGFTINLSAQEADSTALLTPQPDKCIVYIARRSSVAPLIKFGIYAGEKYLGKLGSNRFFAYECDPGNLVFAAKSENTAYLEAELQAGKVYVIDVQAKMGVMYARVGLQPLEKSLKNYQKEKRKFLEFIGKKKGEILIDHTTATDEPEDTEPDSTATLEDDKTDKDTSILKKYNSLKEKGKKIPKIEADMYLY